MKESDSSVDLESLTKMMFFPQSVIELLIAEHYLDTSGHDQYRSLLKGRLNTDNNKLRQALNDVTSDLISKHRRSLESHSVIHLATVEQDENFEVAVSFPKITFTEITDSGD